MPNVLVVAVAGAPTVVMGVIVVTVSSSVSPLSSFVFRVAASTDDVAQQSRFSFLNYAQLFFFLERAWLATWVAFMKSSQAFSREEIFG